MQQRLPVFCFGILFFNAFFLLSAESLPLWLLLLLVVVVGGDDCWWWLLVVVVVVVAAVGGRLLLLLLLVVLGLVVLGLLLMLVVDCCCCCSLLTAYFHGCFTHHCGPSSCYFRRGRHRCLSPWSGCSLSLTTNVIQEECCFSMAVGKFLLDSASSCLLSTLSFYCHLSQVCFWFFSFS